MLAEKVKNVCWHCRNGSRVGKTNFFDLRAQLNASKLFFEKHSAKNVLLSPNAFDSNLRAQLLHFFNTRCRHRCCSTLGAEKSSPGSTLQASGESNYLSKSMLNLVCVIYRGSKNVKFIR